MEEIFSRYWWLVFPLFGLGMGFYGMYIGHRTRQDKIRLIQQYLEQGKEPPPSLLASLNDPVSLPGLFIGARHLGPRINS